MCPTSRDCRCRLSRAVRARRLWCVCCMRPSRCTSSSTCSTTQTASTRQASTGSKVRSQTTRREEMVVCVCVCVLVVAGRKSMNETMCFTTSTLADAVTVCCIRCNVCREHGRVCGTVECATAQRRQQRARHPNAHPPAVAGIREQAQTRGGCVCVCGSGGCARGEVTSWGRGQRSTTHSRTHIHSHMQTHSHAHTLSLPLMIDPGG